MTWPVSIAALLLAAFVMAGGAEAQKFLPDPELMLQLQDLDEDGRISRDEFMGPPERFLRLDTDKDDFVTFEEMEAFQRFVAGVFDDANDDGLISREEFRGPPRLFGLMDTDGDGQVTRAEARAFSRGDPAGAAAAAPGAETAAAPSTQSAMRLDGAVNVGMLDPETRCAMARARDCSIEAAIERGLTETGLRPRFPDGLSCRGIDEGWAISYTHKRPRESYHGGIDMPAPFGTPIVAAASGTVVGKYSGERTARGIEVILRHSPEDTGLPFWTYTIYAHFDEMPDVAVGQRVEMGDVLGPTGNSGITFGSHARRPAIHFAVWYSASPDFVPTSRIVIPLDGWWMDPNAFYRTTPPYDSHALSELPASQKQVGIPVMLEDGSTIPADTRLVWPYRCGAS